MIRPEFAAMLVGLLGTSIIHLSKGMMRHGIALIQTRRAAGLGRRTAEGRRAWLLYVAGVVVNHTNPIWIIWANVYAAPSYYTSMYGAGLIILLVYARFVLGERLLPRQLSGAALVVIGTTVIGIFGVMYSAPQAYLIRRGPALVAMGTLVVGLLVLLLVRLRRRRAIDVVHEILFGMLAGVLAGFDPILKAIGQSGAAGNVAIPMGGSGLVFFLASFVVALCAFLTIQWGYVRRCRAAIVGAAQNAAFVTAPIVVLALTLPGYDTPPGVIAGVLVVNLGIVLMRDRSRTIQASATATVAKE